TEGDGEYFFPIIERFKKDFAPRDERKTVEHSKIACQSDGEDRKDDVKADRERKLRSGEGKGVHRNLLGLHTAFAALGVAILDTHWAEPEPQREASCRFYEFYEPSA